MCQRVGMPVCFGWILILSFFAFIVVYYRGDESIYRWRYTWGPRETVVHILLSSSSSSSSSSLGLGFARFRGVRVSCGLVRSGG